MYSWVFWYIIILEWCKWIGAQEVWWGGVVFDWWGGRGFRRTWRLASFDLCMCVCMGGRSRLFSPQISKIQKWHEPTWYMHVHKSTCMCTHVQHAHIICTTCTRACTYTHSIHAHAHMHVHTYMYDTPYRNRDSSWWGRPPWSWRREPWSCNPAWWWSWPSPGTWRSPPLPQHLQQSTMQGGRQWLEIVRTVKPDHKKWSLNYILPIKHDWVSGLWILVTSGCRWVSERSGLNIANWTWLR